MPVVVEYEFGSQRCEKSAPDFFKPLDTFVPFGTPEVVFDGDRLE